MDALIEELKNKNPAIRWHSVINLGDLEDKRAILSLIEALRDENKEVRGNAIIAIKKLKDARAVEPLLALANDNSKCEIWDSTKKRFVQTSISEEVAKTLHVLEMTEVTESIKTAPTSESKPTHSAALTSSFSYLSIERTIYDPGKRNFIMLFQKRSFPNIKDWIEKNDPSMYWLIICINNNSDKPIDEWGVELETPSTLKIIDARIEGIENTPNVTKSFSKPWLSSWILGIPHHLGIVIPRKGSKRIYFKFGSDTCGISYLIKGKVSTSDCEIPIKEKNFRYSCDSATLKVAIRTNPKEAEKYAQTVLSNAYSKDTALKLLHTFRIVQEIDRCCAHGNYGEIKDKLQLLLDALETAKAGGNLTRMVQNNLESVSIIGDADASAQRAGRLCANLVDAWINEILRV